MNDFWKGYPDYWSEFELKDIVETIWKNYDNKISDLRNLLSQIDDSKSILTLPHKIKRTWLRLRWTANAMVTTYTGGGRLLAIPRLVDDHYNEVNLDFGVDPAKNEIALKTTDPDLLAPYKEIDEQGHWSISLWAPVYYLHNSAINDFFAPLLGMDELEDSYARSYGVQPWSETYYRIVKGLWYVFVNGPTVENIRIGLFILFNIPFALRAGIVVEKIEDIGNGISVLEIKTDDGTELNDRWEFSNNFYCPFNVGDHIEAYTPLVEGGVELFDYINDPNWWQKLPDSTMKEKLEVIEHFCTCLIRVDGVSFFRDHLLSGEEVADAIPDLYRTFTKRILPTFVKAMILLYQTWLDHVDEPEDRMYVKGISDYYDTPYRDDDEKVPDIGLVPCFGGYFMDKNPYIRFDGVLKHGSTIVDNRGRLFYADRQTHYDDGLKGHVIFDRRRLWVSKYSWLSNVFTSDDTPVTIISRGYNWVDVDYQGDVDIYVVSREFNFPRGEDEWVKTFQLGSGQQLELNGTDILTVEGIKSGTVTLVEGSDYTVDYQRENVGEGNIIINFSTPVSSPEVICLMVPYVLGPLDEYTGEAEEIGNFVKDVCDIKEIQISV